MKRFVSLGLLVTSQLCGMYEYRQACRTDVPALLSLMNSEAVQEHDKLVILPKKFRESSLCNAVNKARLFVATENNVIVGYKKLFLVIDEDEKKELLHDELRCIGDSAQCTYSGSVSSEGKVTPGNKVVDCFSKDILCIYDGADFTKNDKRGFGINRSLTNAALQKVLPKVRDQIATGSIRAIALLYGLTCANAGLLPGSAPDRTMSIAKSFGMFVKKLTTPEGSIDFTHARYKAFMPTFDPESEECRPLPDNCSIPGFGCVLFYSLKEEHE